ncbi:MAG: molybdopterin molybdotransferase MoeA [Synergistes sp.]|nr:molybdopterin molybdotransferase MoeA [Synergistes sp.]
MSGFVKEVTSRKIVIENVTESLCFPWKIRSRRVRISDAAGLRSAEDIYSDTAYPPYSRSLRDGYAVHHEDVSGASASSPVFLTTKGEVVMGEVPDFEVLRGEAAPIPTGGILPRGADAVVMIEDTDSAGGWTEVRASAQAYENIVMAGEELPCGERIMERGTLIDFRGIGALAAAGISDLNVPDLNISILSTGDEIVPVETKELPPGSIRDVNAWNLAAMLARYGFISSYKGIAKDSGAEFEASFNNALKESDVLILSGGSSVGVRDRSFEVLSRMSDPGLIVRGINIIPGKPTLIAADRKAKKMVVSLPGHPLSCLTVAFTVLLPLLLKMIGAPHDFCGTLTRFPLSGDLAAHTGAEKFIPCRISKEGTAEPLAAKSGYITALKEADGFICLAEDTETMRAKEEACVWLWQ